ncbi:hypothetical protein BGL_1c24370 [Burkholderia plantarii]|uniref:Uncharacterized protein n=1 Tax=Burkholderia plantarii TaxID=41899 RepID=A0A0B6S0U8_BURPL|nr:hypothetical protein BGL_1c24370 [Burkholderia plantarii]
MRSGESSRQRIVAAPGPPVLSNPALGEVFAGCLLQSAGAFARRLSLADVGAGRRPGRSADARCSDPNIAARRRNPDERLTKLKANGQRESR